MRLLGFILRHILPLGALAAVAILLLSASSPRAAVRVGNFGLEMSALPAATVSNQEQLVAAMRSSGVKYIRQELNWSKIETAPDLYDWSAVAPLDLLFTSADEMGVQVVAVLTGGPVYLAVNGQPIDRKALGDRWEKFVQAAANYYGDAVDIWEIGSEVNSNRGLSPFLTPLEPKKATAPDPVFYTKLLHAAYRIIKDVDPNDQVWLGSLTGMSANNCALNPLNFLLEVNSAKGWKYMDAIAYHPSQGGAAPEFAAAGSGKSKCATNLAARPLSQTQEVQAIQDLSRQLGGKQVVITGLGWTESALEQLVADRGITKGQLKTDLLVRASTALMGKNKIPIIFWNGDVTANLGLMNALTNLQRELENSKPLGMIQGDTGPVFEYRFQRGSETIAITWRSQDGDMSYPVVLKDREIKTFKVSAADALNLPDNAASTISVEKSGQATLMINERPIILTGKPKNLVVNARKLAVDQSQLWKLEANHAFQRWTNNQKAAIRGFADELFNRAKESAIEWGEEKIDELLH